MTVSIEDFMKNGTNEQKKLLFELVELGEQENKLCDKYNEKVEPYKKRVGNTNSFKDGQYAKIVQEDIEDFALIATSEIRKDLEKVREKMKSLYLKAVEEMKMGDLGIIERNYENYVGKKMILEKNE